MRIGFGYDVHKLIQNRKLILGGVTVPFERGLKGHSDADVLLHAIGDAIIGALCEGDIGKHFPDTWDEFKDISSLVILQKIYILMEKKGYLINNIDSTIVAQKPRLADFIPLMQENIAEVLKIDKSQINIKATTTEGLGFTGRGKGIASYAVVSLIDKGKLVNEVAVKTKLVS